jgi:hypothetical protein
MIGYDKTGWLGYTIGYNNITYSGTVGSNDYNVNFSSTLNVWGMLTFVVNRELGFYSIYRNGSIINGSSIAITQPALSLTSDLSIGSRNKGLDMFYSGNLAQISYYNKALSSSEILQNYNALKGRFGL